VGESTVGTSLGTEEGRPVGKVVVSDTLGLVEGFWLGIKVGYCVGISEEGIAVGIKVGRPVGTLTVGDAEGLEDGDWLGVNVG
jgi:hypothetical protein